MVDTDTLFVRQMGGPLTGYADCVPDTLPCRGRADEGVGGGILALAVCFGGGGVVLFVNVRLSDGLNR